MSIRSHWANASGVRLSILNADDLDPYGVSDEVIGQALVIEDAGNGEALVLVGDDVDFLAFARDIIEAVRPLKDGATRLKALEDLGGRPH